MYPHERSLVAKMADKPFALIGVNSDKDRNGLKAVLAQEKITWRSFWNGPGGTAGPISSAWSIGGWPTLFLIDHKGVIRNKWVGSPGAKMDTAIEDLVRQAQSAARAPGGDRWELALDSDRRVRTELRLDDLQLARFPAE
jgi:hypothetical protein